MSYRPDNNSLSARAQLPRAFKSPMVGLRLAWGLYFFAIISISPTISCLSTGRESPDGDESTPDSGEPPDLRAEDQQNIDPEPAVDRPLDRPDPYGCVHSCGFHLDLEPPDNPLLFRNDEHDIDLLMVRRVVSEIPGININYTLSGFALEIDGHFSCIDDPELLSYHTSHHNWMDAAYAWIDDIQYELLLNFQPDEEDQALNGDWSFTLSGYDREGVLTWGPVWMILLDGRP